MYICINIYIYDYFRWSGTTNWRNPIKTNHASFGRSTPPASALAPLAARFWLRWDHRGLHRWWPPWASQPWRHPRWASRSQRWSCYTFWVQKCRWKDTLNLLTGFGQLYIGLLSMVNGGFKALQFQMWQFRVMFQKGSLNVLDIGILWPTARVLNGIILSSPTLRKLQQIHPWNVVHICPHSCRSHWNPKDENLFPAVSTTTWFNGSNQKSYL